MDNPGSLSCSVMISKPLSVTFKLEDSFAILELNGTLTLGPSLNTLRQLARDALGKRISGLILEVSGITMVDSAGVGELTVVYSFSNKSNCALMLAGVPPVLRNILEITRLDALLPYAANVNEAKQKLRPNATGASL